MPENRLFNSGNLNMQEPDLPVPTEEEHISLMSSTEQRLARVAMRIELLPLPDQSRLRGRRREELLGKGKLDLLYPDVVPEDQLAAIGSYLAKTSTPLIDIFSSSAKNLKPTKESLDAYVMAWNIKPKHHSDSKLTLAEKHQALQRRTQHIADKLQVELMIRTEIAALRGNALNAIRHQLKYNQPLDKFAISYATDAIVDFGCKLSENPELFNKISELTDQSLPDRVRQVGERALDNPELLSVNPVLLKLVHLEQNRQFSHWQSLFSASKREHGDRLTKEHKKTIAENQADVNYLSSLTES